jgi:putative PEP-CTERM system histidine kinase
LALVVETVYLVCALAFLLLVGLMVLRGRTSWTGATIILCCLLSAAWAGAAAFPAAMPPRVAMLLDELRLSAWLLFALAVLTLPSSGKNRRLLIAVATFCVIALAGDMHVLFSESDAYSPHPLTQLFRIGLGIVGLLAIENLWRNTETGGSWHVWPLCLALGGVFAYDLFLFADAFIRRSTPDPGLALGQAIVATFTTPLLALAMARNREWRVDIHISRQVIFHTATFVASGSFLLVVGFVALFLREIGGNWGLPLQLGMLIGSVFVLGAVLSTNRFRRILKNVISRNFFSNRYDYRVEWLKFIELMSNPRHSEQLQVRIIRALADFVDSPAGVLWCFTGSGYAPSGAWHQPAPTQARIAGDDPFIAGFRDGRWIQEQAPRGAPWPLASAATWLAVPLSRGSETIGFVYLDRPDHKVILDRESFDLLRAAGRQAASYLAEEQSTKALLDAELLHNYNKRFAFVIHDIKNLSSQLGLIVTNARQHIDDPEFRRDMLQTVENAVARMNHLLNQLKAETAPKARSLRALREVVAEVVARFDGGSCRVEAQLDAEDDEVAIDAERLGSALTHLVQNAIDASPPAAPVTIRSRRVGRELVIEVADRGEGMDPRFVREELFLPFRSTKSGGYGIGAFQTRELIRMSGGELDVISEKGKGTTMRVILPLAAAAVRSAA